ncbi:MAG: hypothetical protein Fur0043_10860 [Anaerolineales bacterium]
MTDSRLDARTLAYIQTLAQAASMNDDWKTALDKLLLALRTEFVYDNVAIYVTRGSEQFVEVAYARAIGRGKSAEADAAWGEGVANQVIARESLILQNPAAGAKDRLAQAYLLGVPLYNGARILGAIVFVRFGGPVYEQGQITLALICASWISALLFRRVHLETTQRLKALQQKVQLQDDFVATISHELRTPLGFIKGYSTTLLRTDTTWDAETTKEFLTIIDEETDRLAQLIENILESAKLQSNSVQLHIQLLRLDALIRDVVIRVRARQPNVDIELHLDPLPPIQGDTVRLAQVFDNLFSNALKYAPGSKITITARKQENSILVTFADHGPGIPPIHLPNIFERFYRVPGENTKTGSGLGLYICNQIIMAHHGKIWVDSKVNQGTTFYIQLPVNLHT